MTSTRQLAAIMFTDIVGYTAIMGKDSAKALELVRISKEIQKPLVEKHNGKWLKEIGDGAMALFSTALDAVNCALEIQEQSRAKFDGKLRIGIHSGDITIENEDVYGDGVNVASRLESIAEPGAIYISESIEKAIQGQTNVQTEYLGELKLKNVAYGLRAYALQGAGLPIPKAREEKQLSSELWTEIQRRGVLRAGATYVALSILLILLEPYTRSLTSLPLWSTTVLLTALIVGLPIALYLAWNYERSPEGFVRTTSQQSRQNPYSSSQRKPLTSNLVIAGLVLVILFMYVYPRYISFDETIGKGGAELDRSIAVLPFTDMSPNKDQEYIGDGLAEDIINSLSRIEDIKVIGRTSSFRFKGEKVGLREIGQKLQVGTILEGSIQKSGDRIRITTQLVSVKDNTQIWSHRYDKKLTDIFEIQDNITSSIVQKMKATLLDQRQAPTQNIKAYELVLKGRHFLYKRTEEGLYKSIEFYEDAIELDPDYALPYAAIAESYSLLGAYHILSPEESISNPRKAATKAIQLDPSLAEAFEALGHVEMLYDWDWAKAENSYQRAIELNPQFATARQRYALLLAGQGNLVEAYSQVVMAADQDPLSLIINTDVALIKLLQGRFKESLSKCKEVLEIEPNFPVAWFIKGLAHEQLGQFEMAIESFQKASDLGGVYSIMSAAKGHAYAKMKRPEEAIKVVQELISLSTENYVSPYTIATVYAGLGDIDSTLKWLQKAVDTRSVWQIHLHLQDDPRFENIRQDPRSREILTNIKHNKK